MKRLITFITSFCYLGNAPFAPGTFGSAGGLFVYFFVKDNTIVYAFTVLFVFTLGCIFSGKAEKIYKEMDASAIVIDEACGMLISLFLLPISWKVVVTGFVIFRVLDIIKPPPARGFEKIPGWGVMLDDLVSALYTNLLLRLIF